MAYLISKQMLPPEETSRPTVAIVLGAGELFPIHINGLPSKEGTPQVLEDIVTVCVKSQPVGCPLLKVSTKAAVFSPKPFADKMTQSLQAIFSEEIDPSTVH
jgi:hypothetical protein